MKLEGVFAKGIIQGTGYNLKYAADIISDPCVYCHGPSDSWEHVLPKSLGGKGDMNRVRACHVCNQRRGSRPLLGFLLEERKHAKV